MGRKIAEFSMAIILVLAMVTMASAAPNVTSTSQKGSLLVFPKVIAIGLVNTYIFIGNDAAVQTWVKCFWMDNNQTAYDFMFLLTPNQPVVFDARTGHNEFFDIPPFAGTGSLVCFAQSADDRTPQDFDHLYGTALLSELNGRFWIYYDAFSFGARGASYYSWLDATGAVTADTSAAVSVRLNLTGDAGYDACPAYLVGNFIPEGSQLAKWQGFQDMRPDLTLWPCRQDLRQDRIPTCTKAKFDIWNENEVKFTGAYQCFKCFFEGVLTDIGYPNGNPFQQFMYNRGPGYGGDKFTVGVLRTEVARFRVQGVYSSVCVSNNVAGQPPATAKTKAGGKSCPNISADGSKSASFISAWGNTNTITPFLGLMLYGVQVGFPDLDVIYGYTLHGAGAATGDPNVPGSNAGFIKVDIGGSVLEKAAK
jgi:hypothetical protein